MVVGAIVFAYQLEKLDDVLQQLLGDALARSVYTDLDTMGTVQHGRGEHADTNRLSKRRGVLIKTSCCICLKLFLRISHCLFLRISRANLPADSPFQKMRGHARMK